MDKITFIKHLSTIKAIDHRRVIVYNSNFERDMEHSWSFDGEVIPPLRHGIFKLSPYSISYYRIDTGWHPYPIEIRNLEFTTEMKSNISFKNSIKNIYKIICNKAVADIHRNLKKWILNNKEQYINENVHGICISENGIHESFPIGNAYKNLFIANWNIMKEIKEIYKNYELELKVSAESIEKTEVDLFYPKIKKIIDFYLPFGKIFCSHEQFETNTIQS